MKKFLFFSLITMIMVACDGCGPINPPDPPTTKEYNITASCGPNGSINPKSKVVKSGESFILAIKPDKDYVIDSITLDGVSKVALLSDSSYTISNIKSNHIVKATFRFIFKEKSLSWYLIQGPWYLDSIGVIEKGVWNNYPIFGDPKATQEIYVFYPSSCEEYWNNQIVGYGNKWTIDETKNPPIFHEENGELEIVEVLNEKLFVILVEHSKDIRCFYSHH